MMEWLMGLGPDDMGSLGGIISGIRKKKIAVLRGAYLNYLNDNVIGWYK